MAFGGLFGGSPSTPVTSAPLSSSSAVVDQLKQQIAQELAVANATELVNKMTENCFEQCQRAPFGNDESVCTEKCLEKYMRAWNTVSKSYISRIQQQSNN